MVYFTVKNFEKFQHYKDRSPPWIKLYNDVLENYEFASLPDEQKGQLILIWLLASRMDNKVPFDPKWVAQKINATAPVNLERLMDLGWIEPYEPEKAKGKREDWPSRYIPDLVKEAVLNRDGHKCVACGEKDNLEFDHIVPVSQGGPSTEKNLQLLCRSCNRKKRAKYCSVPAEQVATQMSSPETETEGEGETEKPLARDEREQPQDDIVIRLPLNDGSEHPITDSQRAEWGSLFPAVDIDQELRGMRAWLLANQRNRKTRTGIMRFVTSWLSRAQNRARKQSTKPAKSVFEGAK